jgi:hypothetical protein
MHFRTKKSARHSPCSQESTTFAAYSLHSVIAWDSLNWSKDLPIVTKSPIATTILTGRHTVELLNLFLNPSVVASLTRHDSSGFRRLKLLTIGICRTLSLDCAIPRLRNRFEDRLAPIANSKSTWSLKWFIQIKSLSSSL